jgi:hypothetical protein
LIQSGRAEVACWPIPSIHRPAVAISRSSLPNSLSIAILHSLDPAASRAVLAAPTITCST